MGIFNRDSENKDHPAPGSRDKSIHVSNVRIDHAGQAWKYKAVWFRQEYLDKLKVMGHFEQKTTQQLVDAALEEFIHSRWEQSSAMRKMVGRESSKTSKPGK